jgi:2-amino-4-hydroxy-6-hydroxymethyldihydropteridine diphosphokinase
MNQAFVGLGSNLQDPLEQLKSAVSALTRLPGSQVTAVSSVYCSAPLGPQDQPDYFNAVLAMDTELTPIQLLDALQGIESDQGRVRNERWGPRTLDLDLLLFADVQMATDRLTIPHPAMHERDFVLNPLAEICGDNMLLPNGTELGTLRVACADNNLVKTQWRLEQTWT